MEISFRQLRALRPAPLKLYLYMLDEAERQGHFTFPASYRVIAVGAGLQSDEPGHGNDGQVRHALAELIQRNLVQVTPGKGRRPNLYTVHRPPVATLEATREELLAEIADLDWEYSRQRSQEERAELEEALSMRTRELREVEAQIMREDPLLIPHHPTVL